MIPSPPQVKSSKSFLSKISGILRIGDAKPSSQPVLLENLKRSDSFLANHRIDPDADASYSPIPTPPPIPNRNSPHRITPQYRLSKSKEAFNVRVHYGEHETIDVVVNGSMKVGDIWDKVKEMKQISDGAASLGVYNEKGALLASKDLILDSKISKKSVLTIKPRPKKEMNALLAFLNSFLTKRATKEELIVKKIIPTHTTAAQPNVEIFRKCIEYMDAAEAFKMEGIFRVSASSLHIQVFYATLESGDPDFSKAVGGHTVPAALKQYLRSFPYGLIGPPLSANMCAVLTGTKGASVPFELAKLVPQIPRQNREILNLLFEFLLKVVAHKNESLMNEQNCAIVFGPSVISYYGVDGDMLVQSQLSVQLLYLFLVNYEQIFGPSNNSLRNSFVGLAQSREDVRLTQVLSRDNSCLVNSRDDISDNIILR